MLPGFGEHEDGVGVVFVECDEKQPFPIVSLVWYVVILELYVLNLLECHIGRGGYPLNSGEDRLCRVVEFTLHICG